MTTAKIIDGNAIAKDIRTDLKQEVATLRERYPHFQPTLAIIQVGNRDDSSVYVRMKHKAADAAGINISVSNLPEGVSQNDLVHAVRSLNDDPKVHGIIVQLPLPKDLDETIVTETINPRKDVDGFHVVNIGNLVKRAMKPQFVPCTPKGIIELLKRSNVEMSGKRAVVVGRSDIVGTPVASLLTAHDATVTICHSRTKNIPEIISQADILVVAIGKPEFVRGEWIKPGAVVIDVGTNGVPDETKKSGMRWVGDVHFESAAEVASLITPVPGGVGPMTVAMLLENTVISAKRFLEEELRA